MTTVEDEIRRDHETATAALRDLLAETEGKRRNGPASDGRGWFRTQTDREGCYAVADALLPLFGYEWEYGAPEPGSDDEPFLFDGFERAVEFMRAGRWQGQPVRRLRALHVGEWTEARR